jgi:alkylation response protein AidB-like acyl-CoA dehydrogenase
MQFSDSETQRLLRTTARSYFERAYPVERLYRLEASDERIDATDVSEIAGLGWLALAVPEAQGGGGATLLDAAVIVEEAGFAGAPVPIRESIIAADLLSETQNAGPLAALASGERLYTVADAQRTEHPDDGQLPLVPFAQIASHVLTLLDADGTPSFVALPLDRAPIEPVEVLDRRPYARLPIRDAGSGDVLATGDAALALSERAAALTAALCAIEQAGMMQRILDLTKAHITTRQQFGQPIGKFQAARHRAADILTLVDTTRWAAYHALWRFEQDANDREEIWLAKHWAARAADRVFQHAHMLHGGVGVGMEHPLHLFTQGMSALAVRGGTLPQMAQRSLEALEARP